MVCCCAPNCHSRSEKGIRQFGFPSEKERRRRWLINCRRDKWVPTLNSRLCEKHFEDSQFESKRADGWKKLKCTAVPTLFSLPNPSHLLPSKRRVLKRCFTDAEEITSTKVQRIVIEGSEEEYRKRSQPLGGLPEASVDQIAGKDLSDLQESESQTSSSKRGATGVKREMGVHVVRDKRALQSLLMTVAENIQKASCQLQETTNRKCQLVQLINGLTQEEILLQKRLKKESDKENILKQQLLDIEDTEKDRWKMEEPSGKEPGALMHQNHQNHMTKEEWKMEDRSRKELGALIEKNRRHCLQIAVQMENDLIAKNSLRETPAAKPMELKVFDGFVAFTCVNNIQFVSLKLESGEDTNRNSSSNPGLPKSSANLTDSSDTVQADDRTMFAEKVDRVECNSLEKSAQPVSNIICVEAPSISEPSVLLEPKHICSFCGKHFSNAGARQSHELTHGKELRCDVCDKVFSCRTGLVNHKRTHLDEKPFECTVCERHFKTNGTLKRHFRHHTREKHYACSVCSETFFYDHQRAVHMAVHTGKQPYMCQDCGRSFATGNCLKRHIRIHSGEKPYECDVCGKRFRQCNQVKAHKEMHGEKPYVCSRCGKRLGMGSFWTHMRQHSDIKVKVYYECAVCDKKLSTKKTLEMHTRMVHMGEAPYVCSVCYKQFGKYKDFQLHKKEHDQCSS